MAASQLDESISPPRYPLALESKIAADFGRFPAERHPSLRFIWATRLKLPAYQYRPLPQAVRFHKSQARWRFLLGGNRSSKSFSLAMETLWASTGLHPWRKYETPNQGFYATTTWDKVGDTLWGPTLERLLHGLNHQVVWHNKQRNIPEMVFVQPKDKTARKFWSKIIFKAYEQGRESFQAVGLRWIHNDEQYPQVIAVEENSRIGADYALDIASAFTPIDPQPWLESKLSGDIPAGWDVFELPLDDNRVSRGGFIADDLIDAMIEQWPPEVRETRRNGKWGSYLGTIYTTFSREIHVVNEEKEKQLFWLGGDKPRPDFPSTGAIDWGGANPFVFLFACRIPHLDNEWYIYDEYYYNPRERGSCRLEQHATEIKRRQEFWGASFERIWADWDPTDAYELAQHGVESQPADKDVRGGIEWVQTLLNPRPNVGPAEHWPKGRPRLHIATRCRKLLEELPSYKWAQSPSPDKRDARDEPVKLHDHAPDAARYLLFSERPYEDGGQVPIGSLGENFRNTF